MKDQKIGWIGTGVMGASMCSHILKAGYEVSVFTRSKEKSSDLLKEGAIWCDNIKSLVEKSDMIFSIVGYPNDVENVYLGSGGVVDSASEGMLLVDMTTSEPALAKRIATESTKKNIQSLDAPVSGGDIGAKHGKLAIMVGGEQQGFSRAEPFFKLLGENIAHMGGPGAGQHTKMSNQILIATTMIGVVESLLYGLKAGLDQEEIINVIGKGAAGSWSINNLGPRIVKNNFDPGFYIKHFVKDMGIALTEAKAMNLSLPGLAMAHQFYVAAVAEGFENLGTQGLYKVFARMNEKE